MQHLLKITKQVQKARCIQWFIQNESIITIVLEINFAWMHQQRREFKSDTNSSWRLGIFGKAKILVDKNRLM